MSSTEPIDIVRAREEDTGEILTVQRAAYLAEAQRYGDPFLPPLTETLEQVRRALRDGTLMLVARIRHRVVGAVRLRVDGPTGHVGRLCVAPDLQGRGVGGRLLRRVETECPAQVTRLELFTGAASAENLRLYQRYGYVVFDQRPAGPGPGLTYLAKPLDGRPGHGVTPAGPGPG